MSYGTTIIPALPGTYKLDSSENSDGTLDVYKTPVLAWAVCFSEYEDNFFTTAHPVTLEFVAPSPKNGLQGKATILHPCGMVDQLSTESSWDTFEEYVAYHERDMKRGKDKNDKD